MSKYKVMSELVEGKSIVSFIFMNSIHKTKWFDKLIKRRPDQTAEQIKNEKVEIKLTVDGEELDTKEVFDIFERNLDKYIEDKAVKLVKERTSDELDNICNQIHTIKEIMDDWSNDINWNTPNQFSK